VRAVASSAEALQALGGAPIDLVVVGSAAGDAGSREATLVEQLVQRWPRLQSRLLLISGNGETQRSGSSAPSDLPTLDRPFTAAELLSAARTVLNAAGR
jgi:hypothetical protein